MCWMIHLWICWIKVSRAGGSDRISEFPPYLKLWDLAISTDVNIFNSVTYNETTNDSITFKFSFASGKVGRLLYSRNFSERTEFFSHASKIPLFRSDKSLKYNHNLKESAKQQFFAPFQSYICSNNVHRYATSVKSNYRHDGDSHIAINFQEISHICNQNYNNIRIICSHVNIF